MGSKRKSRAQASGKAKLPTNRKWRLSAEGCEIAREEDGIFRGRADPAFLVVAFSAGDAGPVRLLGRGLFRAEVGVVPGVATLVAPEELHGTTRGSWVGILAIALEENSGEGIAQLYASTEDLTRFRVWFDAEVPAPVTLDEIARALPAGVPTRAALLLDDRDVAGACKSDAFIGVVAVVVSSARNTESFRFRFLSADAANDWTLTVGFRLS